MKTLISILAVLLFAIGPMKSDSLKITTADVVETQTKEVVEMPPVDNDGIVDYDLSGEIKYGFWNAIKAFIAFVNWLFVIVFILLAWLINDTAENKNGANWFNWFNRIPKILRSLGIGLLLAAVFYWGFNYHHRQEVMGLMFSIVVTMVIYKIGVDKVLRWVSKTFLKIKFDDE